MFSRLSCPRNFRFSVGSADASRGASVLSAFTDLHRVAHNRLVFKRRQSSLAVVLDRLLPHGISLIDVGCGSGQIGASLEEGGRYVSGVDTHIRDSCDIAVIQYDGDRLPFADNSFDWAVIVDVLHHADDPRVVVSEAVRVVRSGIVIKDHFAETRRDRVILRVMDWFGNRQFGVSLPGNYLSRSSWNALWKSLNLGVDEMDESLDLYPRIVRPVFETGLHFAARLTLPLKSQCR